MLNNEGYSSKTIITLSDSTAQICNSNSCRNEDYFWQYYNTDFDIEVQSQPSASSLANVYILKEKYPAEFFNGENELEVTFYDEQNLNKKTAYFHLSDIEEGPIEDGYQCFSEDKYDYAFHNDLFSLEFISSTDEANKHDKVCLTYQFSQNSVFNALLEDGKSIVLAKDSPTYNIDDSLVFAS